MRKKKKLKSETYPKWKVSAEPRKSNMKATGTFEQCTPAGMGFCSVLFCLLKDYHFPPLAFHSP
jgi:hypothetical protein